MMLKMISKIVNYLFLFKIGSKTYEINPRSIVKMVCDVQTSQPKAVPTLFEIP